MSKPTAPLTFEIAKHKGHILSIASHFVANGQSIPRFKPNGKGRCSLCKQMVDTNTPACTGVPQSAPAERKSDVPTKSPNDSRPRGGFVKGANLRRDHSKGASLPFNLGEAKKLCQDLENAASSSESELFGSLQTLSKVSGKLKKRIEDLKLALGEVDQSYSTLKLKAQSLLTGNNTPADAANLMFIATHVAHDSEDEDESNGVDESQNGNDNAGNKSRQWGAQCDESEYRPLSVGSREIHVVPPTMDDDCNKPVVKGDEPP